MRPFQDPSAKVVEAKERVLKLETALAAMEGMEGQRWIRCEPPTDEHRGREGIQIKECESWLARARIHWEELDTKRGQPEHRNVGEGSQNLKVLAQVVLAFQDNVEEVQQLRGLVSQVQTQIDICAQVQPRTVVQMVQCRRGHAVEKNLFFSATRRWRSGWR